MPIAERFRTAGIKRSIRVGLVAAGLGLMMGLALPQMAWAAVGDPCSGVLPCPECQTCSAAVCIASTGSLCAGTTDCNDLDSDCRNYSGSATNRCDAAGTCQPYYAGCTTYTDAPSGTLCPGTTDCDSLDVTCRNYNDVSNVCNGSGGCGSGSCTSYTNNDGIHCNTRSCGFSKGDHYYQTGVNGALVTETDVCNLHDVEDRLSYCSGGSCPSPPACDPASYTDQLNLYSCGACKYIKDAVDCIGSTYGSCTNSPNHSVCDSSCTIATDATTATKCVSTGPPPTNSGCRLKCDNGNPKECDTSGNCQASCPRTSSVNFDTDADGWQPAPCGDCNNDNLVIHPGVSNRFCDCDSLTGYSALFENASTNPTDPWAGYPETTNCITGSDFEFSSTCFCNNGRDDDCDGAIDDADSDCPSAANDLIIDPGAGNTVTLSHDAAFCGLHVLSGTLRILSGVTLTLDDDDGLHSHSTAGAVDLQSNTAVIDLIERCP